MLNSRILKSRFDNEFEDPALGSFISQDATMSNKDNLHSQAITDMEKAPQIDYSGMSEDERRLAKLGYKQELKRQFSALNNFGFTLTNASVIIGVIPLYTYGLATGGPVALVWGWLLTAFFVLMTGLGMAEICSTYPTSGGLYYWVGRLGGRYGPVFSWFEAWFNMLGQWAGCSGSVYAAAEFFCILIAMNNESFANLYISPDGKINQKVLVVTHLILIVLCGIINSLGGWAVKLTSNTSVVVHIAGTIAFMVALLVGAPTHQSASFVFTSFVNETGWGNNGLVFLLGLLAAQWSMLGYDSSAHMAEETKDSYLNGPRGIIFAIIASVVMGFALILALTFSLQDYAASVGTIYGQAPAQIFIDCVGIKGASVLVFIVALCGFLTGIATTTANSRSMYAFARDGGLPGSSWLRVIDARTSMPLRLVWTSVLICFLLALPALGSTQALAAISGVSVVSFVVAYGIPIFLRNTIARKTFKQSEFNLGPFSGIVGILACSWSVFIFVLFELPQVYPATSDNLNYCPVAVGIVVGFAGIWWMVDAHKWFKGPRSEISGIELNGTDSEGKLSQDGSSA